MSQIYRVAYLVSHPIQYQAPLLRQIAACSDIDLTVYFLSDLSVKSYRDQGFGVNVKWDVPLLNGYRHIFLPAFGRRDRLSFWRPFSYGLWPFLSAGRFDALWVHGYASQACLRAVAIAKSLGMKVLLRGESHLISERRSPVKRQAKAGLRRMLFSYVDSVLAIGTLNREYYVHYGVPESKIFMMPYAVDNEFFRRKAEEARSHRELLRAELNLEPGRPIILYVSKFQRHKRPSDLLEAYIRLSPDCVQEPQPYLLFIGDGDERPRLEQMSRQSNWSSIIFLGFKNQTELPRYYDLCDVFVLPSEHEPWGLVVNEVMNAGKPIIVSDRVGCGPDLVKEGVNGFVVPVGDVKVLTDRLKDLTENLVLSQRMGAESLKLIEVWNFEVDIRGLLDALDYVVGGNN